MNRDIEFRLMEESDAEGALELLAKSFCNHDPIEVVLGITEPEFIEMIRLDLPQIFRDSLSIVAELAGTNELIGVTIALDATTAFTDSTGKISPKFAPVAAIVNQLHHPYLKRLPKTGGHTAYYYMGAVKAAYQGRGVARRMFKAAEDRIASKLYKRLFGISTNRSSLAALEKNGFHSVATVSYQDFVFQGQKPFASIQKHSGLALIEKDL